MYIKIDFYTAFKSNLKTHLFIMRTKRHAEIYQHIIFNDDI